jgi:hypothetical protein
MEKILEDYLWSHIAEPGKRDEYHRFPRYVIADMLKIGMINSHKQAYRTLEKWSDKGKYEYGTYLDMGWKIEK